MVRPAKETRQQMPSEPWGRSDRTWSEALVQRADRSAPKGSATPRVPLVPRSTRGYWLATTPWFVVEGSSQKFRSRCADLRTFKYRW